MKPGRPFLTMAAPSDLQNKTGDQWGYPDDPKEPRIDKVRAIFGGFPGRMKVLDIGCANGAILKPLLNQHEIHGVDISASLLKIANDSGIKAVRHDLEAGPLPYDDKTFDAVFCGETIEHHVDTDWLMSEANRVLKPNGKLVLTFPNIRTLLSVGMMLFLDLPPMYAARYRAPHYRDFTLRTVKIVLRNHNFRLEKAVGGAFFWPRIGEFGSSLATYFPSWSSTVIAVTTKLADSKYNSDEAIALSIY